MAASNKFRKNKESDSVFWVDNPDAVGEFLFSFDKKRVFNLFQDYPFKLTAEEKKIFDSENPEWAEFFSDRK